MIKVLYMFRITVGVQLAHTFEQLICPKKEVGRLSNRWYKDFKTKILMTGSSCIRQ